MMKDEVQIVELPASRIVSFYGFGKEPENTAIGAMLEWASVHHYFEKNTGRCFGFNNPDPSPGSPNYGYEVWLTLPEDLKVEKPEPQAFEGGLYAVSHCEGNLESAGNFIPSAWKKLMEWLENSAFQMGKHQWLEEQLCDEGVTLVQMYENGRISLNLFMPIAGKAG